MIKVIIKHHIIDYIISNILDKYASELNNISNKGKYVTVENIDDSYLYQSVQILWTGRYKHILGNTCNHMYVIPSNEASNTNECTRSRYAYFIRVSGVHDNWTKYNGSVRDYAFNEKCHIIL